MRICIVKYIISLFFFLPSLIYSQTEYIGRTEIKVLRWGGVLYEWKELYSKRNINIVRGPLGKLEILLADNNSEPDRNTDLYLNFDSKTVDPAAFSTKNYNAIEVKIFPQGDIKKFGTGSGGFLSHQNRIKLKPLKTSIFLKDDVVESFTTDFYLYPTLIYDDTTVISWYAPTVESGGEYTGFKAFFQDGRLYWLFERIFRNRNNEFIDVLLGENDETPLNEWHHHALYYDSSSGLLTLYFDGRESNLKWLTESGAEKGTVLRGHFSRYLEVPITLGESYLGYIDDFRISRGKPDFYPGEYRDYGEIVSNVIDLKGKGTELIKVSWDSIEEYGTAVRVYYRISDAYFLPYVEYEDNKNVPQWVQVKNNVGFKEGYLTGRYFQWKALLYGTKGKYTPHLFSLNAEFEIDPPPYPPAIKKAIPLDGGVSLAWAGNSESDISGYKIYYGSSSMFYFGKGSDRGDSPVFVGSLNIVELKGLNNEDVYFISVTALDQAGQESGFSNEVIVRPSKIYGDE